MDVETMRDHLAVDLARRGLRLGAAALDDMAETLAAGVAWLSAAERPRRDWDALAVAAVPAHSQRAALIDVATARLRAEVAMM